MKRILILLILMLTTLTMLTGCGLIAESCGLTVESPEIEEGEFPFSVTYEFNGEVKTVSGVYVCEYTGMYWTIDGGAHRGWNGYIKDNKYEDIIELGTAEEGGEVSLTFNFYPEYFMGDPTAVIWGDSVPCISVKLYNEGLYFLTDPADVEEYCGAKIISYEYAAPIENTFN